MFGLFLPLCTATWVHLGTGHYNTGCLYVGSQLIVVNSGIFAYSCFRCKFFQMAHGGT
ncbi:hypothetical protein K438DRAFT_1866382 [Mycena galopus ATCC 62051]|nr:hypothetical protein K438DRAFT_1866382 [Mycena galopus ATCC 62051]